MSILRRITNLFHRSKLNEEIDAELRSHIEMRTVDNIAAGISPQQAAKAARQAFGNPLKIEEDVRAAWGFQWLETLMQDIRYAFRQFRKSLGFTVGAVGSLMLGIGATTVIFSVVYAVLLDPYPYKDANRIAYVQMLSKDGRYSAFRVNGSQFEAIRKLPWVESALFEKPDPTSLTDQKYPVAVTASLYSPNLFAFLGVPPLLGRVFTLADVRGGNPAPVVVLSYRFWRKQYLGNRALVGKTIEIDHAPYTVIGVMPPRFAWGNADIYRPGVPTAAPYPYWMAYLKVKRGTNYAAAKAEIQTLADRLRKDDPDYDGRSPRVKIVTLNGDLLGRTSGTITSLFVAALLLLIIGCANVSILLLARAMARRHEFAVRASLGADRGRLVRQMLTESVLLSIMGAAFGVLFAWWGVNVMRSLLPYDLLPHEVIVRLSLPVLAFSAVMSVITGALFGLFPALELSRPQVGAALQEGRPKFAGNTHLRKMHRLPIAGQVALTLLLLSGAGGAAKAFLTELHSIQGFDMNRVLAVSVSMPDAVAKTRHEEIQQTINDQERVRQLVAQSPGVADAGWSALWFPGELATTKEVEIQGKPALTDATAVIAPISPQLLSVLHVPLLRGRIFDRAEERRQAHVAVVNQAFVKQYLAGVDPIGQMVRVPSLKKWNSSLSSVYPVDGWLEVIGLVGDATNSDDLDHPTVRPAVFVPNSFFPLEGGVLYARASNDPDTAIRFIEARVQVDPDLTVFYARTLRWELDTWGWGRERLIASIFALYAFTALVLAATGLYSVVSFVVTQRTHELGVRMALGAGRGAILQLVLKSTVTMLVTGLVIGLMISEILGPIVSALGGAKLTDPTMLLAAALILMLVAAIACVVPARRATRVDPMVALRYE